MPWARMPPDKLINLPLFGIDLIADDGDFVWMRGPSGRMRINKLFPRVWFENVEDAHQAGAVAIRITTIQIAKRMMRLRLSKWQLRVRAPRPNVSDLPASR